MIRHQEGVYVPPILGSIKMPKQFPPEIKERALGLYIKGDKSAREIAEILWDDFATEVKPSTIYLWARDGEWGVQQVEVRTEAIQKVKETEGQRFARTQQEHLNTYESMRHKAGHELEHLNFDKASDAAKALDMSIKGEREVIKGMINLQFVQNVLSVLVEEINDEDTLKRVAGRLKGLIQTEEPSLS